MTTRDFGSGSATSPKIVIAGLVPAISIVMAPSIDNRDGRDTRAFTRVFDALWPPMTTERGAPLAIFEYRELTPL
jgi:hypothetical protein